MFIKRRRAVLSAIALAGAAVLGLSHSAVAVQPSTMQHQSSGYCVDDPDNSTTNGTPIQLFKCLGDVNQEVGLEVTNYGNDTYYELFFHNGKCIDDPDDSATNGEELQIWSCLGNENQAWSVTQIGSGYLEFSNANGKVCIDDYNDSNTDGNIIQVWSCSGDNAQQWNLPRVSIGNAHA